MMSDTIFDIGAVPSMYAISLLGVLVLVKWWRLPKDIENDGSGRSRLGEAVIIPPLTHLQSTLKNIQDSSVAFVQTFVLFFFSFWALAFSAPP